MRDRVALERLGALVAAASAGTGRAAPTIGASEWERLLASAAAEQLLPLLWSAVERLSVLEPVPAELVAVLGRSGPRRHPSAVLQLAHAENAARNRDLMTQLRDVAALLDAHDIEVVALKGSGLVARGVFDDPAVRVMADLDLLVRASAATRAHELLRHEGYEPREERSPEHHHLDALRRADRAGSVELHVRPLTRGYDDALSADEVFAGATPCDGIAALVPSATHAAVIGLVHAYLADRAWVEREIPVRTVHELWRVDRREPIDWDAVRRHCARVGHGALVDEYHAVAHRLFGAPARERTWRAARARARLALSLGPLRPLVAPVDRVAAAFDVHRLERFYGSADRGPWRLRARHFANVVRRARR